LNDIARSAISLVYTLELDANAQAGRRHKNDDAELSVRVAHLRAYVRAAMASRLAFTYKLRTGRAWILIAGRIVASMHDSRLSFTRLPSFWKGVELKEWEIEDVPRGSLFTVDVEQDLLIILTMYVICRSFAQAVWSSCLQYTVQLDSFNSITPNWSSASAVQGRFWYNNPQFVCLGI
jgi:hypothetical protein